MATDCLRDDFYLWDSGSAASIQYRFPNAGLPVSNVPDRRFHRTGIFTSIFLLKKCHIDVDTKIVFSILGKHSCSY